MKDRSQREIEASRPTVPVDQAVRHCLAALMRDEKHLMQDEVVDGLVFEELLGALLLCNDIIEKVSDEKSET